MSLSLHPDTLRGSLSSYSLGARGLALPLRNPGCARLRAPIIAQVSPAEVAREILKVDPNTRDIIFGEFLEVSPPKPFGGADRCLR